MLRKQSVKVGPYIPLRRVMAYPPRGAYGATERGSDARQRADVRGICGLCHQDARLLLSHVIPRWAYRWLKDEGGVRGSRASGQVEIQHQDGAKHYLLCIDCEQYLGEGENYLRFFCTGSAEELEWRGVKLSRNRHFDDLVFTSGVNDQLMRRALLGILL